MIEPLPSVAREAIEGASVHALDEAAQAVHDDGYRGPIARRGDTPGSSAL
jgi:hypothetical protein